MSLEVLWTAINHFVTKFICIYTTHFVVVTLSAMAVKSIQTFDSYLDLIGC